MIYFIIYHPYKERHTITLIHDWDYAKKDYSLASRQEFSDKDEAVEYAKKLAEEHNLKYKDESGHDFLD